MKKVISLLCVFILMSGILTGCSKGNGGSADASAVQQESTAPSEESAGEDATTTRAAVGGESISKGEDMAEQSAENGEDYSDYLRIDTASTDLGIVQIPVLDTKKLNSRDAELSNEMFENLKSSILQNVDEVTGYYKQQNIEYNSQKAGGSMLCEAEAALNDNNLSVLLHYQVLSPTAPSMWYYEGVNIDVRTGKTVPGMDLVKKAGYSKDIMEQSIKDYCSIFDDYLNERTYYFGLGGVKYLPDPDEAAPCNFQSDPKKAIDSVYEKPELMGESWDELDRFPLVLYKGDGNVSVVVKIETPAGIGYEWNSIRLAKSAEGVFAANRIPIDDNYCWHYPKSTDAALFAAYDHFASDGEGKILKNVRLYHNEKGGAKLRGKTRDGSGLWLELLYVENLSENGNIYDPYYVIKASSDSGDVGAGKGQPGLYAVSVFDDRFMQLDEKQNKWKSVMKGTPVIDSTILHDEQAQRAAAVVSHNLNPYELWSLSPYTEINVWIYSYPEVPKEDIIGLYIWPHDDDRTITLISGQYDDKGVFEGMSEIVAVPIERGTGAYLEYVKEQEGHMAVRIENDEGTCLYMLEEPKEYKPYEYLYPTEKNKL